MLEHQHHRLVKVPQETPSNGFFWACRLSVTIPTQFCQIFASPTTSRHLADMSPSCRVQNAHGHTCLRSNVAPVEMGFSAALMPTISFCPLLSQLLSLRRGTHSYIIAPWSGSGEPAPTLSPIPAGIWKAKQAHEDSTLEFLRVVSRLYRGDVRKASRRATLQAPVLFHSSSRIYRGLPCESASSVGVD